MVVVLLLVGVGGGEGEEGEENSTGIQEMDSLLGFGDVQPHPWSAGRPWELRPVYDTGGRACVLIPTHSLDMHKAATLLHAIAATALDSVSLFIMVTNGDERQDWQREISNLNHTLPPHTLLSLDQLFEETHTEQRCCGFSPKSKHCILGTGAGRFMGNPYTPCETIHYHP